MQSVARLILIFLGIFLRSLRSPQTYFTFEDTLTQIGLGYVFLFLLGFTRVRTQVVTLVLILICFWAAFALYPAPGPHFDYARVGVPQNWPHLYTGFLSHWNKNSNLSWAFDVWFLNLFPREHPVCLQRGWLVDAEFYSDARNNDLGLAGRRMAQGQWIEGTKTARTCDRGNWLTAARAGVSMGGHLPHRQKSLDVVLHPVQRRLGGADTGRFLRAHRVERMAAMGVPAGGGWNELDCHLRDELDHVGASSANALERHFGSAISVMAGPTFQPVLHGFAVMLIFWFILFWMYRRKIFLRI